MQEQTTVPTQYLRLPEAAAYIHMSPQFLRRAHREGRGPDRIRVSGKVILFARTALDSWLTSQADVSTARTA
jgi:predicted DNA-binding transcriptional regulator AlpA